LTGGSSTVAAVFPRDVACSPAGLTLERIFGELPSVPLDDEVSPEFLRENARRVFRLDPQPKQPEA